jgi:hypothetical protein
LKPLWYEYCNNGSIGDGICSDKTFAARPIMNIVALVLLIVASLAKPVASAPTVTKTCGNESIGKYPSLQKARCQVRAQEKAARFSIICRMLIAIIKIIILLQ